MSSSMITGKRTIEVPSEQPVQTADVDDDDLPVSGVAFFYVVIPFCVVAFDLMEHLFPLFLGLVRNV